MRRSTAGGVSRFASVRLVADFEEWEIALHGRRVIYRITGSGPPVVLIHGMLNSSRHWQAVAGRPARDVKAPLGDDPPTPARRHVGRRGADAHSRDGRGRIPAGRRPGAAPAGE